VELGEKALNALTNATIASNSTGKLRMYVGNSFEKDNRLTNRSDLLANISEKTNVTLGNQNFTYLVVINDTPDQRLSFSVMVNKGN
jgi:hypothetical protein